MAEPQRRERSLTVRALWLMTAKTLAFILAFALPILLTRSLSQTEYGLFKQVFLLITTATSLLPLGFGMSAYYYLPREKDERRRGQVILNILLFSLLVGVAACVALILRPTLLASIFKEPTLTAYAPLVGIVIPLWLLSSFLDNVAVANQELRLATIFIILGQLSKTIVMFVAALAFDSVEALIYAALIQGALQTIVLLWYLGSRFPRFWRSFDLAFTRTQIAYAIPFGVVGLLYTIQMDLHNYFVSNRFNAATFAIYSIGVAQLPLIGILRDSVSSVILPRMSYLQKHGETRAIVALLASAIRKLAAVYLPMYAFLMVTGREFLTVLFTSAYVESWPVFAVNLTLLPLSLLEFDAVTRAYEGHRLFLVKVQVVLSLLLVFALWLGILRFGLLGAISVVVVINFLLRVIVAIKFGRVLGITTHDLVLFKDVGKLAVASGVAGLTVLCAHSLLVKGGISSFGILLVCAVVFAPIYISAILLLRILNPEELRSLRQIVEQAQRYARPGRTRADLKVGEDTGSQSSPTIP